MNKANLPQSWTQTLSGVWSGSAPYDAQKLIDFAISRNVNSQDEKFTTLGSVLSAVLRVDPGLADARTLAAIIVAHKL